MLRVMLKAWQHITWLMICFGLLMLMPISTTWATFETDLVSQTIYVNPLSANASDDNPGTQEQPFRTLQAAVDMAQDARRNADLGTKILLAPATYREDVYIVDTTENAAPIVVEAIQSGTAIISGSEVYTGWSANGDGTYTHLWDKDWGFAGNPWGDDRDESYMEPIVKRTEMVFVDGVLMKQVLERNELEQGSFYVDENADQIVLYPFQETNMERAFIEVAERDLGLQIESMRNIVLRGIVVKHVASSPNQAGVFIGSSENVIVDDCYFVYNNWVGLEFEYVKNIIIRDSHADLNGERGMGARRVAQLDVWHSSFDANNWRGAWGNWFGWDAAGFKCFECIHTTLYNVTASDNEAMGIWFDYVNNYIEINQAYVVNNYGGGLFIEASFGPVTVRNSQFLDNRSDSGWSSGGVFITGSNNVLLTNNILAGNEQNQIRLNDPKRDVIDTTVESTNLRLMNNLFVSTSADQYIMRMPWYTSPSMQTLISINNEFYMEEGDDFINYNYSDEVETFDTWITRVNDVNSTFANGIPDLDLLSPINAAAEPSTTIPERATYGLQALYEFKEGAGNTIHPSSGTNAADLIINNTDSVVWIPGGGIEITNPTLIASEQPLTGLSNAIMQSNEITIEAWVRPGVLEQYGPARILTLSDTTTSRNFMLGQGETEGGSGALYNVRLRTTATDVNGTPSITSQAYILRTLLTHVVYTRDADGNASLYLDGIRREYQTLGGSMSNWNPNYELAIGNELTNDRPWLGTLYLAAVYDRALTPEEVDDNFVAGLHTYLPE